MPLHHHTTAPPPMCCAIRGRGRGATGRGVAGHIRRSAVVKNNNNSKQQHTLLSVVVVEWEESPSPTPVTHVPLSSCR